MRVGLDGQLLGGLIKARGGVRAFVDDWNAATGKADDHPDNGTIYRWIKGETVPKSGELYLRLAGLLDVDPFALVAVPDADILAAADELLRVVQHTHATPSWLQFVHRFFGRHIAWPPQELASTYFKRSWYAPEFEHDAKARTNFYATIVLQQSGGASEHHPQVFHFAYRHPSDFRARWLQYGLVRLSGRSVTLHHIGGYVDTFERTTMDEPIRVETWFGPGPARFCVASLHPFAHNLEASTDTEAKKLRFPA